MIYTDGIHLISDTSEKELHEFAESIGLKRCWFEGVRKKRPHYDLTIKQKTDRAIAAGACLVSSREIVRLLRNRFI